jgi:hypothetical protein
MFNLHSWGEEDWVVCSTTNSMFVVEKPLQITTTHLCFVRLIHRFQKYFERREKRMTLPPFTTQLEDKVYGS